MASSIPATAEHPKAQTVFILSIVGIFVGICAPIAWYLGTQAKKEIAAGAPFAFAGNLKTGTTLGKVFTILYIIGFVLYIVAMIAIFALAAANPQ